MKYRYTNEAMKQLADWARAWVQNETVLPEVPDEKKSDAEKGALLLMELLTDGESLG